MDNPISLLAGETKYMSLLELFLQSFVGKFLIISLCWTFSFHTIK